MADNDKSNDSDKNKDKRRKASLRQSGSAFGAAIFGRAEALPFRFGTIGRVEVLPFRFGTRASQMYDGRADSKQHLGEGEVFAAEEGDDGFEGGGPVLFGGLWVVAEGFDVEADDEAFLGAG